MTYTCTYHVVTSPTSRIPYILPHQYTGHMSLYRWPFVITTTSHVPLCRKKQFYELLWACGSALISLKCALIWLHAHCTCVFIMMADVLLAHVRAAYDTPSPGCTPLGTVALALTVSSIWNLSFSGGNDFHPTSPHHQYTPNYSH